VNVYKATLPGTSKFKLAGTPALSDPVTAADAVTPKVIVEGVLGVAVTRYVPVAGKLRNGNVQPGCVASSSQSICSSNVPFG
jgi:hypothetical protein